RGNGPGATQCAWRAGDWRTRANVMAMTRKGRTRARTTLRSSRTDAGGTLLGMFIGIAVGILLAGAVAFYLMKAGNPYQAAAPGKESTRESGRDAAKVAKAEPAAADRPRFDFYKILSGIEEPKVQGTA